MGVQIVHYKDDFLFVWVNFCQQASDFLRPVQFGPAFTHTGMAPSCKGFRKYKYAACPAASIFCIQLLYVAWPCRQRVPHFTSQLVRLSVHADNGDFRVVRHRIYMQDVLHASNEFSVLPWRDAPIFIQPWLEFVFFNIRRMVSLQTGSATPFLFASRVRSSNVQSA